MNDIKLQAYNLLIADTELISLLATNEHAYDPDTIPASKANSIVDYLQAGKMIAPFITLRADDISRAGRTHLTNAFLLVRCYNEKDKSFYTINRALSRVQRILDGQRFTVEGYATVEVAWETTRAELQDDGLGMNFREAQFRIQLT